MHHPSSGHLSYGLLLSALLLLMTACTVRHPEQGIIRNGQTVYRGGLKDSLPDGYGQLSQDDSTVYEGQWKAGQRCGHGIAHDPSGRRIVGEWRADTLFSGTWTDSTGCYTGDFDRSLLANGYGRFDRKDGESYEGFFRHGQRWGFGFSVQPGRSVRLGEWRAGKYLGERLEYSAERIYGIDISRFQHDIGKKKYAIDWSQIRITSLGKMSRKRIRGVVDYPVSFVYIKSTEGTTVRNRYYKGDYLSARKRGLNVGSYHFFSTTSPARRQADWFVKHSYLQRGDFPPVLDVEPSPAQIKKMGGTDTLFRAVRTWLKAVERQVGVRPVLYVSQSFVNRYLPLAPDIKRDYLVWIARYGEYKPDVHLVYWQLSPDGRVSGIHGDVDINVFNGYAGQFDEFLDRHLIP